MKSFILSMSLMQVALAGPEVILSPLDNLYVPSGFDNNDSVEVVVTGRFSNPCYSRNKVDVSYNEDVIDITVTALVPDPDQKARACPDMIVPFKEVISLGNLQGGEYKIVVNRDSEKALSDKLHVSESSSSAVDDHIYEAIEWVEQKSPSDYVIHGIHYSPCFKLDEIKVVSNHKNTLSILPIMKQVSSFCPMKGVQVSYPVKLDFSDMQIKNPLLHVRTIDGKSVNAIVDIEGRK